MNMENHSPLSPAMSKLMETCIVLKTTDAKTLATHLNRSPSTIRTQFQRILENLNVHSRYEALETAKTEGWFRKKPQ